MPIFHRICFALEFCSLFNKLLLARNIKQTDGGKINVHFNIVIRIFFLIVMNFYSLNKFIDNGRCKLFHFSKLHKSLIQHFHINRFFCNSTSSFSLLATSIVSWLCSDLYSLAIREYRSSDNLPRMLSS